MDEIETLITKSLQEFLLLKCIANTQNVSSSKLVFPIIRNNQMRLSEQEARFLLIKQLENKEQKKYQYSIETPTEKTYSFTGKNNRSGNIDLCIYENGKRKSLIEFKALNPQQNCYSKDFEKLLNDGVNLENYFIQVLKNTDSGTIKKIEKKYKIAINDFKTKYITIQSSIVIFICDYEGKKIIKYEIDKKGNIKLLNGSSK